MLHLALAVTLAAAPVRPPVAPRSAGAAVQVRSPKTALADLRAFLADAGSYAPALRPVELGRSLGAMLGADLLDPASLEEAGVDLEAPVTVSFQQDATVVCLTTVKGARTLERARAALAGNGQPATLAYKGAQLEGASAGKIWHAGFVSQGKSACFASGGADALPALKAAVDALGGAGLAATPAGKAAAGLDAPVMAFFQAGEASGALEVHAAKGLLRLVGRAQLKQALLDKPKDADPLAALALEAPLVARASFSTKSVADPAGPASAALGFLVANACKGCDAALARSVLDGLKAELTGSVGVVAKGLDPAAAMQPMGQYFLFQHAYLLPVKDAEKARKALEAGLDKLKAKSATVAAVEMPEGSSQWSVAIGPREVRVGVAHGALFLANDPGARDIALSALEAAKPGTAAHAASFAVNGPLATAALRRITVLDVPKSQELAALFAFGVEMGSLVKNARQLEGFADPDGAAVKFELGFQLEPPPKP